MKKQNLAKRFDPSIRFLLAEADLALNRQDVQEVETMVSMVYEHFDDLAGPE